MKKNISMIILLTISLLITSCGPGQIFGPALTITPSPTSTLQPTQTPTPTPLPPITFENASSFPVGAEFTIVGKLCLPSKQTSVSEKFIEYYIWLIPENLTCRWADGEPLTLKKIYFLLQIPVGETKNHVKPLPGYYTYSDLKIITSEEAIVGHESIIKLVGRKSNADNLLINSRDIISIHAYP